MNRSTLTKNNIWSKTAAPRIKTTGNSKDDKNNEPNKPLLQKSNVSTNTKLPTRLTRANPNLNRPLRSMVTPAQKTQKPVARGISKINISSVRRRQTVALKDIQAQFKPNPVSLQEILTSKTSRDITMKRQSLASSKLGSINSEKPSFGSSRSRMTYSYRVEVAKQYHFIFISLNTLLIRKLLLETSRIKSINFFRRITRSQEW